MYRYTKQPIYLQYAKTLSDYFIKRLPKDGIAMWGLDSKILQKETSASAIFVSALIEMTRYIDNQKQQEHYVKQYTLILNSLISAPYFIEDTSKAPIINKSVHYYTRVCLSLPFEFCSTQRVLIKADEVSPSILSKSRLTKSKMHCVEPEGQHLLTISTAFSLIYVE